MASKIVWSERALSDLRNIIEYLEQHWTDREKARFAVLLETKLQYILFYPQSFKASHRYEGTRECLVHKNLSLFYTITIDTVNIVSLWDNRRNPKYIKKT